MSSSASSSDNINVDTPFQVQETDILVSDSTRYLVMDSIGEGCFGQVAKCLNLTTKEVVAVKIHKSDEQAVIRREAYMLKVISALDPEKSNIVRFGESFSINNLSCFTFEMLDRSLVDLMNEREMPSLRLNEIRPVIHQLLVAFDALKGIRVVHGDLKPDNIMLVNHTDRPYRVKLIDFGLASPVNWLEVGEPLQVCGYRAPEVTLGLPMSEAVDMWGLGCVMAYLCFDMDLFPVNCDYQSMKTMVQLLGQPEDDFLNAGTYSNVFFSKVEGSSSPGWRLKSPEEFEEVTGLKPEPSPNFFDTFKDLEDAVQMCQSRRDALEYEDTMAFLSLLKSCLHLDPSKRITPKQALKHPFIAMTHLVTEKDTHSYAGEAHQFMAVCPIDYSDEEGDRLTHTTTDMKLTEDSPTEHLNGNDADIEMFSGDNLIEQTGDLYTGPHKTYDSEADNTEPSGTFQVQKYDLLFSGSTRYLVMDSIGEGCFGQVAKCRNLTTEEVVAVKIHKTDEQAVIRREAYMLNVISALDPEKSNIVRFGESFNINNLSCLTFEMLDRSLVDLMNEREMPSLRLNEIRPVIHQLLVAFDALKGISVVHGDLKPDNIMLVNHTDQPYRVKLIDFGLASPVNWLEVGEPLQVCGYRAPEVTLGLPMSEAVDMWGLGCVMAYLCFEMDLFPVNCDYQSMKTMVQLLGQPEDDFLNAGTYSNVFFSKVEGSSSPGWRLKSPEEFEEVTGLKPESSPNFFDTFKDLEDAVQMCQSRRDALEYEDTMAFLSLLKSCLHLDPSKRITPKQALKHPFIAMTHLVNEKGTHSYAGEAHQFMAVCPIDYSDEEGDSQH